MADETETAMQAKMFAGPPEVVEGELNKFSSGFFLRSEFVM